MIRRDSLKAIPLLFLFNAGLAPDIFSGTQTSQFLCIEYLAQIIEMFEKIRSTELDNLLEASYNIARTRINGGNCFCQWETGHSFDGDMFPGRPGNPDIFILGYTMGKPSTEPGAGDLLLVSVLRKPLEDPRTKGIFVIGGPTPWCADTNRTELLTEANRKLKIKKHSDIWIETYITTHGALLWLPGETAPLGPSSGALGIVTYWAMIADTVRLLADKSVSVKVMGGEPQHGESTQYVSLTEPLAERYIEECIRQIGSIEAELGTVNSIAGDAVDCILSGGSLYVYSRYREALCQEAHGKRGGLALIKTTYADDKKFNGTAKDFMIMGIYQPDDSVDIQMLEKFRAAGMKIAAIGPATSNGKVPDGRTVPGEADYHLGLMCDTYGLFAVPGVERKVCPTSGLLVNVMFWVTAIQIAEEIMKRTGNTPAVLSTGAMIGGGEQRRRRMEMVKLRGY